ncbi:hypothetical protein CRI93_02340 [Longimonas halophila]|uniref:Uncharacterized protein n=1 Tax=Longimonas halophila TaxID=1469170 RepID=A0A2H3P511_9BACT|nr:YihY/virulence factor BrkB family protein [Longimonas halophila]PEN09589.1 hypothetical protein CRI93_02340 [Longimonas halophila]
MSSTSPTAPDDASEAPEPTTSSGSGSSGPKEHAARSSVPPDDQRLNDAVRRTAPLEASSSPHGSAGQRNEVPGAGQAPSGVRSAVFSTSWRQHVQTVALYYIYGLIQELQRKDVVLWSQAIAFKVLITIVPILILGIGLLGRVLRGDTAFNAVMGVVRDFLPVSQEEQVISFLTQLQDASGAVIGLGGVGLFLSAFSLFITLRIAVRNAFAQTWHEGRSILSGYLFDMRMVGQVGLLFLATILLSFLATTQISTSTLIAWGIRAPWLLEVLRWLAGGLAVMLPFLITTAMFFQLYYLVPLPHPRKRSALVGATLAAGIWEILKYAFTYYAVYVGQFDRYAMGAESFSALGNTFGLMVAFVFWVYFSGIVFMLGAVVASLHEHRHVMARHRTPPHTHLPKSP